MHLSNLQPQIHVQMYQNLKFLLAGTILTYWVSEEFPLNTNGCSMDLSLLMDTQLGAAPDPGPGPGPGPGLCCSGLQHNTHRALSVNPDGGVI